MVVKSSYEIPAAPRLFHQSSDDDRSTAEYGFVYPARLFKYGQARVPTTFDPGLTEQGNPPA